MIDGVLFFFFCALVKNASTHEFFVVLLLINMAHTNTGAQEASQSEGGQPSFYRLQHGATCPKVFVGGLNWDTSSDAVRVRDTELPKKKKKN